MSRDTGFYNTIKRSVPLEDYFTQHLGVDLVPAGPGRMACICPFHEEDTPSCNLSDSDDGDWKRWYCFAEQEGGTIIDAVMRAENFAEPNEAAEYLNELYDLGLEANSEEYKRFRRTVAETKSDIERSREEITKESRQSQQARAYLHRRGFTDETIDYFELGLDTTMTKAGRLSIPIYDIGNSAISIVTRALFDSYPCATCKEPVTVKEVVKRKHQSDKAAVKGDEPIDWKACPHCGAEDKEARISWLTGQNPKYRNMREFDKSEHLYHANKVVKYLRQDQDAIGLFLCEGQADVWTAWQAGHTTICNHFGAVLSDWQARKAIELAVAAEKPIILIPDTDSTGQGNIEENLRKLRSVNSNVEIQLVVGIDEIQYEEGGVKKPCKDIGEILQHFGTEKVAEVLENNRIAAPEWEIRRIVEAKNSKTGQPFHSRTAQMKLIAAVLENVTTKEALDHLVAYLARNWKMREDLVQNWFHSKLNPDNVVAVQSLVKDAVQSRLEAQAFLSDTNVIPLGFDELDRCLPGGGARPGQLMMLLGKSGTGKAQPLDAKVLTPSGWRLMGALSVGDEVINPRGPIARVIGVFPQGEREIYRVGFDDGGETECDLEHLWQITRDGTEQVKTLREILEEAPLSENPVLIPSTSAKMLMANPEVPAEVATQAPVYIPARRMVSADPVGRKEAQCIKLDSENELYITDDWIITHNTMLASQMLANMADRDINSIFFSLEQRAGSFYSRLACQALDMPTYEAEELIRAGDPSLEQVDEIYKNMYIVDNVPTATTDAVEMSPGRIQAIIQEINMTKFGEKPADIVIIDHLGILEPGPDAPRDVRGSDLQAPGYIMQELFKVCKATNVFMIVLQQLPKEVAAGVPFSYDAGRGGSKQTDFCDFILQIYRPEQKADLDDNERAEVEGQYKIILGKNRYGSSTVGHFYFDKSTLRIMPVLQVGQPQGENPDGPVIEIEGAEELRPLVINSETDLTQPQVVADPKVAPTAASGEGGASAEAAAALVREIADPVPLDAKALLESLGATEDEDEVEQLGDPELRDWFDN